ncbi:MAG: metallophosphoesterase family protein [bacterium]
MLIAVISDIHSNLHALDAVLQDADNRNPDKLYCLGDIVGYGAFPKQCVDLISEKCDEVVFGNHEYALLYPEHTNRFNQHANKAIKYAIEQMSENAVDWLRQLEPHLVLDDITIAHGSIRSFDEYVSDATIARLTLEVIQTNVIFVGHTHYPEGYEFDLESKSARSMDLIGEGEAVLEPGFRYLINVGSVGQPRDGDARASYGMYNTESKKVELIRVKYNIKAAAVAIKEAGLPDYLGDRLFAGR